MRVHVLGSINLDVILQVETLPGPGETVLAGGSSTGRGGKGANQAVAAARFGASVTLHGAVGEDEAGDQLRGALRREGVDIEPVVRRAIKPTGKAFVMVSTAGENMIVVQSGANMEASFQAHRLTEAALFLTQLETPCDAALAMFKRARPGDLCVLNAAPPLEAGRALFPLVDVIIVNEGELAFYAAKESGPAEHDGVAPNDAEVSSLTRQARSLICKEGQHVIVTRGPAGALVVRQGDAITVPGCAAEVVDTTGAGDCFVGVMAAMLSTGAALPAAAKTANRAAALSVGVLGADSAPRRQDVSLDV